MNSQSAKMEKRLAAAIAEVEETIASQFGLTAVVEPMLYLDALIEELNRRYAKTIGVQFEQAFVGPTRTSMKPDGGFMWIKEWGEEPRRYVLVAEAKWSGSEVCARIGWAEHARSSTEPGTSSAWAWTTASRPLRKCGVAAV